MSSSTATLTAMISALNTLVALGAEIALLVVAIAIVRPKRPDAFLPILIGAIVMVLITLGWPIASSLIGIFTSRSPESINVSYALLSLLTGVARTAAWGSIVFGIVRLASPPGGAPADPTRYG